MWFKSKKEKDSDTAIDDANKKRLEHLAKLQKSREAMAQSVHAKLAEMLDQGRSLRGIRSDD